MRDRICVNFSLPKCCDLNDDLFIERANDFAMIPIEGRPDS